MQRMLTIGLSMLAMLLGTAASGAEKPKKIYGHYMGCFVAGTGAIYHHATTGLAAMDAPRHIREEQDPLKRALGAWAKASHAGSYRDFALSPYGRRLSLEAAADLEVRRAMRIGMDGFTFDAWAGRDDAKKLLSTMFRICEEKDYPFELTITLDASCLEKPRGLTEAVVEAIRWLLENHGKSPKLARRDGKPIIFGYQSAWPWVAYLHRHVDAKGLKGDAKQKEVDRLRTSPEGWQLVGPAFKEIEERVGQPIYWEFCLSAFFHGLKTRPPAKGLVDAASIIASQLPAVGAFAYLGKDHAAVAKAVIARGAEWSQPMWLQYENYGWWQGASPGTDWIRGNWAAARELPSTLMQYITWNDYHESTNLSPGYNSRYTYYELTGYFIRWWKEGEPPAAERDRVYVLSHKYTHGSPMFPFKAKTRKDNVIEVVSILPRPATLRMPGRDQEWEAPAGFSFHQAPLAAGPVVVELVRDGQVAIRLEHPEPVSDRPFRQDTGKTSVSTEFDRNWRLDFGDEKPFVYSEYGDADGDGLPNWFEMLWFGKFGDMGTATVAKPDADPDGDGKTNVEEWRAQTDPTAAPPPLEPTNPLE